MMEEEQESLELQFSFPSFIIPELSMPEFCLLQASHRSLCCVAFQFILHLEPSEHVNWCRHSHLPVHFHFWSSPRKLDNFNSELKQHFLLIGLVSRKQWWKTKSKVLATFSFVGITVPFICFSRSPSGSAVWVEIIVQVHECTDIVVQVGTAEERLSYTLPTSPLPFSFFPPLQPDNIPFCSLLQFHQFHKNAVKLQPHVLLCHSNACPFLPLWLSLLLNISISFSRPLYLWRATTLGFVAHSQKVFSWSLPVSSVLLFWKDRCEFLAH